MSEATDSITVRVPLAIRRRPGRKTVVMPEGAAAAAPPRTRADPALVKALARVVRLLVERVEVGPAGADIRLRVAGLASLVRDLTAVAPKALRTAA